MAEILIFTILGSLVAIYSVLPQHKKLRINYALENWRKITLLFIGILIIISSILISYTTHQTNLSNSLKQTQQTLLFLMDATQIMLAITGGIIFFRLFQGNTPITDEKFFQDKMQELLNTNQITTYLNLLESHLEEIFCQEGGLSITIAKKLREEKTIEKIIEVNPYFGINLIESSTVPKGYTSSFVKSYLSVLLRNQNSVLYEEIENNRDLRLEELSHRYIIKEDNRLLYSLLSDPERAKEFEIWQPIGEVVSQKLDSLQKDDYDPYNEHDPYFTISDHKNRIRKDENRIFRDPIFVGIRFFDIMVFESIYRNTEWHMWLYYYETFAKNICRNFQINEYTDPQAEFPNRYAYLLYTITANLKDWTEVAKKDPEKYDVKLSNQNCENENGNILKSSIICLTGTIDHILSEEQIPYQFKEYLVHSHIFKLYFELRINSNKEAKKYAKVLQNCLLSDDKHKGVKPENQKLLAKMFRSFDRVPYETKKNGREEVREFQQKIHEKLRARR